MRRCFLLVLTFLVLAADAAFVLHADKKPAVTSKNVALDGRNNGFLYTAGGTDGLSVLQHLPSGGAYSSRLSLRTTIAAQDVNDCIHCKFRSHVVHTIGARGRLQQIDFTNIATTNNAPVIGTSASPSPAMACHALAQSGGVVYACCKDGVDKSSVFVFDIGPNDPVQQPNTIPTYAECKGLAVDEARSLLFAFNGTKQGGIVTMDISDRLKPAVIDFYETAGSAYDGAVSGANLYVADEDWVGVYSLTSGKPVFQANGMNDGRGTSPTMVAVAVSGNSVFTSDWSHKLLMQGDFTNLMSATVKARTSLAGNGKEGLEILGEYLYVTCDTAGLYIYKITSVCNVSCVSVFVIHTHRTAATPIRAALASSTRRTK